jgi:hypothetical protein
MNFKIVKLEALSGERASIYAVYDIDKKVNIFEQFIRENVNSFKSETFDIRDRLMIIGHQVGARPIFFKFKEGKPGDGICALYDEPNSNLRLYCIRYGTQIVILGGGGPKSKDIRAFQDDEKLKDENYYLREISNLITKRIKDREIKFSIDGLELIGDFEFNEDEQ